MYPFLSTVCILLVLSVPVLKVIPTLSGTAIYIYGILPPPVQYTTTYVNVSVQLDGQVVGRFEHHNTGQTGYQYNVTVYQNTSLEHGVHNVVITARRDVNASYFAFDWAQYT